ncbi:MAG: hypothetical protein HYX60_10810 [Legionella longbeachae]|nr:hypothetical protein [Legionella longbeachae]
MLREYRALEENKKNFKINADNKIKKQAKSFSYKYRELLKKEWQMSITTIAAIVGAIGTYHHNCHIHYFIVWGRISKKHGIKRI